MLVKIKDDYAIIDLPKDKIETKDHELKVGPLDMQLDRHAEWTQIYNEAWRQMRDFFYAPNMNGIDWKAMRDKYAALVPFVNNRNDLTYLIGELIGELNNGWRTFTTPSSAQPTSRSSCASTRSLTTRARVTSQ
jgi:tricorn protease